jgi:hypothetical protein
MSDELSKKMTESLYRADKISKNDRGAVAKMVESMWHATKSQKWLTESKND